MHSATSKLPVRVVIASDGKRGHENQSYVTARMLGDTEPLVLHLRPRAADLSLRLQFLLRGPQSLSMPRAAELVKRCLQPAQPDAFRTFAHEYRNARGRLRLFTVSTGTQAGAYNLVLSRMLSATPVVNMTPSLLPRRLFELNIVPEHDVRRQRQVPSNVITTPLALGYHDVPAAQLLATRLASEHHLAATQSYLGVCIGAATRDIPYPAGWCELLMRSLLGVAQQTGMRLVITTSRRTLETDTRILQQLAQENEAVAYFLDARADPLNPLPAFYELAQAMLITADSYSMVSEAIHAGHTPLVLAPPALKPEVKVVRSLAQLKEQGLLTYLTLEQATALAELSTYLAAPPKRQQPNRPYEQLRLAVRDYLGLE